MKDCNENIHNHSFSMWGKKCLKYVKLEQNQLYLVMWREIPSCRLALSCKLKRNERKKMTNEMSSGSESPFGCQWVYPTWHLWTLLYILLRRKHGDSSLKCPPSKLCTPKELAHWRWALQRLRRSLEGRGQAAQAQPQEYIISMGSNIKFGSLGFPEYALQQPHARCCPVALLGSTYSYLCWGRDLSSKNICKEKKFVWPLLLS